jgi:hypothetical protein
MPHAAEVSKSRSPSRFNRWWLVALGASLLASFLIVAPFFGYGSASGHDFEFHTASWLDVAGQWKEGIAFPRWTEWANHGFGEPRFIFYPPLSWLLGAALGLVVPWSYVPVAFIVLVQTFAGFSAFLFARRLLPARASVIAAICYLANPNALLIIYMRSDYAELLAAAFLPLLFLATLQLGSLLRGSPRSLGVSAIFFSAMFAAVWLSNAPAGVMASYGLVCVLGWAALTTRSWKPIWRGIASLALGFGLAGFYVIPAAYEQRWVNIGQVLSSGLLPSENFLYTVTNDPEHTWFNWIASTIAVTMIVVTGLCALFLSRESGKRGDSFESRRAWFTLLLLGAVATFPMLRPSAIFWRALPKLRFVQFPWRWMTILALVFACFFAGIAARRYFRWLCALMAALLFCTAVFLIRQTWWDSDDVVTIQSDIAQGNGFDGTDEYDPVGDDHYNLPAKASEVEVARVAGSREDISKAQILISRWTAEEKNFLVTTPVPVELKLRLLNYPAWHVEVNGRTTDPQQGEDSSRMLLSVPVGNSRITIKFTRTVDRKIGGITSLGSLLIIVLTLLWELVRDKPPVALRPA